MKNEIQIHNYLIICYVKFNRWFYIIKYLKHIFHFKKNMEGFVQVRKKRSMHGKKKKKNTTS